MREKNFSGNMQIWSILPKIAKSTNFGSSEHMGLGTLRPSGSGGPEVRRSGGPEVWRSGGLGVRGLVPQMYTFWTLFGTLLGVVFGGWVFLMMVHLGVFGSWCTAVAVYLYPGRPPYLGVPDPSWGRYPLYIYTRARSRVYSRVFCPSDTLFCFGIFNGPWGGIIVQNMVLF